MANNPGSRGPRGSNVSRALRLVAVAVVVILPLAALRDETVRGLLVALLDRLRSAGPWGVALFAGIEVAVGLTMVPIWLPAMMAGYVWGFPGGVLAASPGVALAGCAGFLAGRALTRLGLRPAMLRGDYWEAVQRAMRREGLKVALLLRVTPVMPQNALHYLLATTDLSLARFALGTWLGLVPMTLLHVYLGSLVKSATSLVAGEATVGGPLRWAAPAAGLVATVTASVLVARLGRRMLAETLAAAASGRTDNLSQPPPAP